MPQDKNSFFYTNLKPVKHAEEKKLILKIKQAVDLKHQLKSTQCYEINLYRSSKGIRIDAIS